MPRTSYKRFRAYIRLVMFNHGVSIFPYVDYSDVELRGRGGGMKFSETLRPPLFDKPEVHGPNIAKASRFSKAI